MWITNDWTSREFYDRFKDECLFTVLVSVGDQDTAQELVAEAFAVAVWASWQKVGTHPAPQAWVVRTALNVGISRWRRAPGGHHGRTSDPRRFDHGDSGIHRH